MSFKPKNIKKFKVNKKNSTTLDGKHKEFVTEFNKDSRELIPNLKKNKLELQQKIDNQNEGNLTIEELMDIKDQIKDITGQLRDLKNKKSDYFLDNSKYIFDYFENKKSISTGDKPINKNILIITL